MNTFITGATTMIGLIFVCMYFFNTEFIMFSTPIALLVNTLFSAYVFKQVFNIHYFNSLWRTFIAVLMSFLVMLIVFGVLGVLITFIFLSTR